MLFMEGFEWGNSSGRLRMIATVPGAAGAVNRSGVMAGLRVTSGPALDAAAVTIQAPSATTM
jgi:hypothetical protein